MPLTRDFKKTVQARAQRDPAFREGLLKEGVECLLAGDIDAGKIVLRDYINAIMGFEEVFACTWYKAVLFIPFAQAVGRPTWWMSQPTPVLP